VKTLQEAVQLSLKDGFNDNCLFTLSRALRAFEVTTNRRLPPNELPAVFALWWNASRPQLPLDMDFDEWRMAFEDTFSKTRAPLGSNSLQEAIRRANTSPLPPEAARYPSAKLKRLIAVCYQLQLLQGNSTFYLGVRDAARILGIKNLYQANALLAGLVRDGILIEVEKGTRKRATRFRFNLPPSAPPPVLANPDNPTKTASPPAAASTTEPTKPSTLRKSSTYQLAEKKKALQDLIDALGHKDWWTKEQRGRHKELKKELKQVNLQLAGLAS
jgi:hypothetical protein